MNNPNSAGCNVKETISILKFPQFQGSLQLERKVALDQVAYEREASGLKSLKILGFSRCNESTIGDGAVNSPNPTCCNVKATISVLKFPQVQVSLLHARKVALSILKFPQFQGSLQLERKVALDQVAYEREARGLKRLKILGFSRCNESTIGDGAVNSPNPTCCNVKATISVLKFPQVQGSLLHAIKVALDQIAYEIESRGLKS